MITFLISILSCAFIGFIASRITGDQRGFWGNVGVAMLGGIVMSLIASAFGLEAHGIIASIIGAVIVSLIFSHRKKNNER